MALLDQPWKADQTKTPKHHPPRFLQVHKFWPQRTDPGPHNGSHWCDLGGGSGRSSSDGWQGGVARSPAWPTRLDTDLHPSPAKGTSSGDVTTVLS